MIGKDPVKLLVLKGPTTLNFCQGLLCLQKVRPALMRAALMVVFFFVEYGIYHTTAN